jgi:hypothetical protein
MTALSAALPNLVEAQSSGSPSVLLQGVADQAIRIGNGLVELAPDLIRGLRSRACICGPSKAPHARAAGKNDRGRPSRQTRHLRSVRALPGQWRLQRALQLRNFRAPICEDALDALVPLSPLSTAMDAARHKHE